MKRTCTTVATLLIAACTPKNAAERAIADCQRRAAGPIVEAECHERVRP